jgi:MauM/NapG family ferredoxin protein
LSENQIPDKSAVKLTGIRNHSRLLVRIVFFTGAVLCLLPIIEEDILIALVPALSPFVAVTSILATKTIRPILGLGLVVALVVTFRHRWFCRWVCPMGLCLDGASYVGKRLKRKPCQSLSIGRWLLTLTLGGAILGYPLFLWLDPLALFTGLFLLIEQQQLLAGAITFLFIILLLILSLLKPHIWCRGLCPLGAFQDLLSILTRFIRSIQKPATDLPACGSRHPVARRTVLGLVVGAVSTGILRFTGSKPLRPLRPPGAVNELTFKGLCTRCGNCIRSCPYDIIIRDTGKQGFTDFLTPVLTFEKDYCREDCNRCTLVCPSGALTSVSLDNKPDIQIGVPKVDMNICLLSEDRECSACARWCPYNAIRYVFSEAEYMLIPVIDANKCNGCGACEVACPTKPQKAIRVLPNIKNS